MATHKVTGEQPRVSARVFVTETGNWYTNIACGSVLGLDEKRHGFLYAEKIERVAPWTIGELPPQISEATRNEFYMYGRRTAVYQTVPIINVVCSAFSQQFEAVDGSNECFIKAIAINVQGIC